MHDQKINRLSGALFILSGVIIVLVLFALLCRVKGLDLEPFDPEIMAPTEPAPSIAPMPTPIPLHTQESTHEPEPAEVCRDDIPLSYGIQDALFAACEEFDVEPAIVLGVIKVESCFQVDADNGLCYGLMQLNRNYFPSELSPEDNIRYGVEYLGQLLAQYNTVEAALTAYNAGADTGSRAYADAVLAAAEKWR